MPIPRLVSRLGLFLLLLAPLHAQPLPLRTWTDTQGRTIQARMTEGTETTVTVRRDDGRIFTLELEKLSTDDRDYVRKELEKRIPPPDLVLSLSRVQLDRQETGDKRDNLTRETEVSWGYSIGLENRGVHPAKNLRLEYVLFGRKDRAPGRADEKNAQLLRQSGRATIAEIGARQRHYEKTDGMRLRELDLKSNVVWGSTGTSESLKDSLVGIWVRVYQGDKLLIDQASPESLRKEGW